MWMHTDSVRITQNKLVEIIQLWVNFTFKEPLKVLDVDQDLSDGSILIKFEEKEKR